MKLWQWAYLMWILSIICYYISGKQLEILIFALLMILLGTGSLIKQMYKEARNEQV